MGKKKEVTTTTAEQKVVKPISRQAARQIMRRRAKQPLDVSQAEWHREKGFSKIARKAV